MFERAKSLLSHHLPFGKPVVDFGICNVTPPTESQMILRMMVKRPGMEYRIPDFLSWLAPLISRLEGVQRVNNIPTEFVYITVRHGVVSSITDDLWHVDGFSMRTPHRPEQNYIWTDSQPTEVLNQKIILPSDFDPMRHNIHNYFQDVAKDENIETLQARTLYGIDPYVIHRRPQGTQGTWRTFFRISFIPIEIEDDTCMVNPLILKNKAYGRGDIRHRLERYSVALP